MSAWLVAWIYAFGEMLQIKVEEKENRSPTKTVTGFAVRERPLTGCISA
jgi:hypothetical protein